jgi:cell division protein ZapE
VTPVEYYHKQISSGSIVQDEQQWFALQSLQNLYFDLLIEHKKRSRIFAFLRRPRLVQGIYLWGGVGIGKTFLMDCFYQSLPFPNKIRMHFHQFMQFVHKALKEHQGKKDPLQIVAKDIAKKCMVLCFDELIVSDIVDAMLLGRLFKALFTQGVSLVATSNTAPHDLYKDGLQRRQFLPAITLLKQKTKVIHLPSSIDYRLRHLKAAGVFYTPNDDMAHQKMEKAFALFAKESVEGGLLEVHGRMIPTRKLSSEVVWFDFNVICHAPRSQLDYLAIAEKFHTVFVSDIPIIPPDAKNKIALLIRLVDIFYDAKVRLICSAEKDVKQIYTQGNLIFDFARTQSRLLEMQSEQYVNSR